MRLLLPSLGFYWHELEVLGLFCLEASEYCATKHFVTLARLLLESLNCRPMVTATAWPSSQFNSVHGPISSSIFCHNSRAHHQAMPVKQGESTRLSRRGMKCVRVSSHALPFVPARKRFIRNTQISSMTTLRYDSVNLFWALSASAV